MKNTKSMSYITDLQFSSMFRAKKKGKPSYKILEGNIFTTSDWGKRIYNLQSGGNIYADVKPESISMNTGVCIGTYTYLFTGDLVKVFKGPGDIYNDMTVFAGAVEYYKGTFGVVVCEDDIKMIKGFDKFTSYNTDNDKYIVPLVDIISKGYKLRIIG